jgi:hypothetical protein
MATDNEVVALPTTGTATYAWVGGTTPTQSGGSGWAVDSTSSLDANFGTAKIASNLTVSDGVTTFSTVGNGSTGNINVSDASFTINESVLDGKNGVQVGNGAVNGVFVGNDPGLAPKGAAVSYQLGDISNNPVTGTGAFARQ